MKFRDIVKTFLIKFSLPTIICAVLYKKYISISYGEDNIADISKQHEEDIDQILKFISEAFSDSSAAFVKIFTNDELDKKIDVIFANVASSLTNVGQSVNDKLFEIIRSSFDEEDKAALTSAASEEEVNARVKEILNKVALGLENIDNFDLDEKGNLVINLAGNGEKDVPSKGNHVAGDKNNSEINGLGEVQDNNYCKYGYTELLKVLGGNADICDAM